MGHETSWPGKDFHFTLVTVLSVYTQTWTRVSNVIVPLFFNRGVEALAPAPKSNFQSRPVLSEAALEQVSVCASKDNVPTFFMFPSNYHANFDPNFQMSQKKRRRRKEEKKRAN